VGWALVCEEFEVPRGKEAGYEEGRPACALYVCT
jgi:hypothetical protein